MILLRQQFSSFQSKKREKSGELNLLFEEKTTNSTNLKSK
jgi:hypothetical protein